MSQFALNNLPIGYIPYFINMAQINMQDEDGDTALIEACDGSHEATAALLIDKGARVDYKNKVLC